MNQVDAATPGRDAIFLRTLAEAIGPDFEKYPDAPVLVCGMAGSREGWREAPYAQLPVALATVGRDLTSFAVAGRAVHIVPGIAQQLTTTRPPDVMRGEETQLVGIAEQLPDLPGDYAVVLPGTHTKWVRIRDGVVTEFSTSMTGELFAAVRDHTVVGRMTGRTSFDPDAFDAGVRTSAAGDDSRGLAATLFSARTLALAGALEFDGVHHYLSGALIGDEVAHQVARLGEASSQVVVCGSERLCSLYARALAAHDVATVLVGEQAGAHGLYRIATRTGLIAGSSSTISDEGNLS